MANVIGYRGNNFLIDLFKQNNLIVLLGSQSPRRQELFSKLNLPYKIVSIAFDEKSYHSTDPVALAKHKNFSYAHSLRPNEILLTADTMVFLDKRVLGKPGDENQAKEMLMQLSGRSHEVITGVSMRSASKHICFKEKTVVWFDKITGHQIEYYIEMFKPFDKAGAYGIQEWIGMIGIKKIEGDFYNVMGLPVHQVWKNLENMITFT